MAGFLDKESRIIDMVLTAEGKRLRSKNELEFVYYAFFDDEIDYDPYVANSGSLTDAQVTGSKLLQVEAALVREAVAGYLVGNTSGSDTTNVIRPIYTMPQGQRFLPTHQMVPAITASVLEANQRRYSEQFVQVDQAGNVVSASPVFDRGFQRYDEKTLTVDFTTENGLPVDQQEGVLVRVFRSGTEGLVEVKDKRDLNSEISFMRELRIRI